MSSQNFKRGMAVVWIPRGNLSSARMVFGIVQAPEDSRGVRIAVVEQGTLERLLVTVPLGELLTF
jgi:hypothetical protein